MMWQCLFRVTVPCTHLHSACCVVQSSNNSICRHHAARSQGEAEASIALQHSTAKCNTARTCTVHAAASCCQMNCCCLQAYSDMWKRRLQPAPTHFFAWGRTN